MKILIAEDDLVSRRLLETTLQRWGHEVLVTCNGRQAWEALQQKDAPPLAILDWMMPEMDGVEVCRRLRVVQGGEQTYVILLTTKADKDDIVAGLDSGADDYLTKPFDREELRARIKAGSRILSLQTSLAQRVRELQDTLAQVKQLHGLMPICCYCKKIRDDQNYWQQVESFIAARSHAQFSHSICPDCYTKAMAAV